MYSDAAQLAKRVWQRFMSYRNHGPSLERTRKCRRVLRFVENLLEAAQNVQNTVSPLRMQDRLLAFGQ